ncbi:TatD family hydrolase [Flavobacterium agrisoli]|uniref:TatD family hydrolase n=1 Tax=Flavobacterium agrisoli TaxID=2793066 RepID=A0A934PKG0_9FLAO|nr:TatD family hydrolase [Flavobacterium agrisoli]MBK0368994.1 TatD family hydrolase [Flavobacterium agrisoli]
MLFFNLHTHSSTKQNDVLELVNQCPHEFEASFDAYSIGIHPWYIQENRVDSDLKLIEEKLTTPTCLAIGECGLDKKIQIPLQLQETVFEKQLLLAERFQKPVIIHCVAAFQEIIAIKKKLKISVPMVVHGFSKNQQTAKQLLENDFYLSFGKNLIQNSKLESVFKEIPLNRIFLETDMMDVSIESVYELASKFKNIPILAMQQAIAENVERVFKIANK